MFKYLVVLLAFMVPVQGATLKDQTAFIRSAIEKTIETQIRATGWGRGCFFEGWCDLWGYVKSGHEIEGRLVVWR